MKSQLLKLTLCCWVFCLVIAGCKKEDVKPPCEDGIQNGTETGVDCGGDCSSGCVWRVSPSASSQDDIQEALILMNNNDTLELAAGTYNISSTLSIEGKTGVVIRGAGMSETLLDFSGQATGAQGFLGTNLNWFLMHDFAVLDAVGDGVKLKDSDGISIIRIHVEYTGPVASDNGAYGLYPVTSKNVLIDGCYVRGSSDAGIYVGQSEQVVVRNNIVEENVAGMEIENCINSDVYSNTARNNTGGIMAFDLENLPVIPNGGVCRIFDNTVINNNHKSFAPAGNVVASIPVGTGIMILSFADVEIFNNTITDNYIMGIGVLSMYTLKLLDEDTNPLPADYDPYVYNVNIHDNNLSSVNQYPDEPNGTTDFIINDIFGAGNDISDIIYDGFKAPVYNSDQTEGLCIRNNGNATFADVAASSLFTNPIRYNAGIHDCSQAALSAVVIDAPEL